MSSVKEHPFILSSKEHQVFWMKNDKRLVRKHSLFQFTKQLHKEDCVRLTSLMAHALNTNTLPHYCHKITNQKPHLIPQLPLHMRFSL